MSPCNSEYDTCPVEYLELPVYCVIDDAGGGDREDGTLSTYAEAFVLLECYDDAVPLHGDFTAQLIDAQGNPVGPRTKTLTVCPGSYVRLRVNNIKDSDHKIYQDVIVTESSEVRPINKWRVTLPLTAGFQTFGPELVEGSDCIFNGNGPTDCYTDIQVPIFDGTYEYGCTIEDLPDYPTVILYGEHMDLNYNETIKIIVSPLECDLRGTKDIIGDSGGCGSCSGGSGGISIDASDGTTKVSADAPGLEGNNPLNICINGTVATWKNACDECVYFNKVDNNWLSSDPDINLSVSANSATISYTDGGTINFACTGIGSNGVGTYYQTSTVDSSGATTTYAYDATTGAPTSVTYPDGKTYEYGHTGGHFGPTSVTYPDGEVHMLIEYGTGVNVESPTKVTIVDPVNPETNQTSTTYTYDSAGNCTSITQNSGIKTLVDYDYNGKVSMVRVYNVNDYVLDPQTGNQTYEVYSQTGFEYDYEYNELYEPIYGLTRIRQYADTGSIVVLSNGVQVDYIGDDNDETDRVQERYYYLDQNYENTFLRTVKDFRYDGEELAPVTSTILTVNVGVDSTSKLFGKILSEEDTLERVTTYDYYDPEVQYNVSNLDDAPYPDTSGTVYGNGELRQVTMPDDSTTSYAYKIDSGVMTSYTTVTKNMTKDSSQNMVEVSRTKSVINSDGSVAEVYQQNDQGTLEKTKSYTYYPSPDTHKGLVWTETVEEVSSMLEDMVTTYAYDFTDGELELTTTVENGVNDRVSVTHYNTLGQMDWSQDEYDRQTDYTYDWQGRSE